MQNNSSVHYCNEHFSHYAVFAIRPLRIAYYKNSNSKSLFDSFGRNFTTIEQVKNFTKQLVYDDSEFFEPEEVMFFCKFQNYRGCQILSNDIIESDRQILLHEIEHPKYIFNLHAKYLLKAIDFWILRSNKKLLEWSTNLNNTFHQWEIRTKPFEYYSEDEQEYSEDEENEENDDDGYFSNKEQ